VKYPPGPILDRDISNLPFFSKGVVVFDRDGTLVEDAGQHNDTKRLKFLPGAIEAIKFVISRGFGIAIASNQSGLESEKFTLQELNEFNNALKLEISQKCGGGINLLVTCPHLAISECNCRKPKLGLMEAIGKADLGEIRLFVGDSESDRLTAEALSIDFIDVQSGRIFEQIKFWSTS
jgi:D-glycero-D-manno-heptose 1,7-bisphosphate phosphatase